MTGVLQARLEPAPKVIPANSSVTVFLLANEVAITIPALMLKPCSKL